MFGTESSSELSQVLGPCSESESNKESNPRRLATAVVLKEWSLAIGNILEMQFLWCLRITALKLEPFNTELCGLGGENSTKAWVWVVQAWEVRVCLKTSKIAKAKPLGESVLTENLGGDNTCM